MGQILITGIAEGAIYALFAFGLVLVYKATRVLNFAQAEVGTFATYLLWSLTVGAHLPWLVALVIALAGVGLIGLTLERLVIRPLIDAPRLKLVVATVTIGLLLEGLVIQFWGADSRIPISPFPQKMLGPQIAGFFVSPPRMLAIILTACAAAVSAWFFRKTTFGLALLAAAHDVVGVRLTGIRMRHLSAFTWVVSSIIGGLAGIIISMALGAFDPATFTARIMLYGFAAAVVGGMTSLPGALAGGILIGVFKAAVSHIWISVPGLVETLLFGAIVLILIFRPRGLLGKAS